jgi:hypothetical protein
VSVDLLSRFFTIKGLPTCAGGERNKGARDTQEARERGKLDSGAKGRGGDKGTGGEVGLGDLRRHAHERAYGGRVLGREGGWVG